jgi:hypothetical protein
MKSVGYWKVKGQAPTAESPIGAYLFSRWLAYK